MKTGGMSHWDMIYRSKAPTEVSWYQPQASTSLELIQNVAPDRRTPIIDVGAGASTLVDDLLNLGYLSITVVDLSPAALGVAQRRLGGRADRVTWLTGDVLSAPLPASRFGVWHDRAAFHFLTDPHDRTRYVGQVRSTTRPSGHVIVASFGLNGPARCSGLDVVRYDAQAMHGEFGPAFRLLEHRMEDHRTPSGKVQSFVYCVCRLE